MTVKTKKVQTLARVVVPVSFKAATTSPEERTFEGLAAVWDLDLGGDIIHKGAFAQTIKDWKASGDALPLLNSHDHFDIMAALGQLLEAKETKDGLWTKWEVIDGPDGDAVMARLRPSANTGRSVIGKMSIGFEPVKWTMEQPEGTTSFWDQIRHLEQVNLKEVSLVLFPMAPGASIDVSTVKSFMQQTEDVDGTMLSPEMKVSLRKLAGRIGTLLSAKKATEGDGTTPPAPPAPPVVDVDESDDDLEPDDTDDTDELDDAAGDAESSDDSDEDDTDDAGQTKSGTVYEYGDALSQRLRKTLLKHKASAATTES